MKSGPRSLALLGGEPEFAETMHVGRPNIPPQGPFLERVQDILRRKWLTNDGPCVQELERRLESLLQVRHCVCVANGTLGLELTARALGLEGSVILPSFTFVATAHALRWLSLDPVFGDIDPKTFHLDPARVEELITSRTTAIMGVHLWGRACDTQALESIARKRKLRVLYDAAHAFGCSHLGRPVGGFGDAEIFSFHATKCFHTLEGGAVTTNNDELARKLRLMRNFGFSTYDRVECLGTNAKMHEISAAMGLSNLDGLASVLAANRENFEAYRAGLAGIPGLGLLGYDGAQAHNYQYVVVEVDEDSAGLDRDRIVEVLHAERVFARRYFYPSCHRMPPYNAAPAARELPATERAAARVVCLPTGPAVGKDDISRICEILRLAVTHAGAIRDHAAGPGCGLGRGGG